MPSFSLFQYAPQAECIPLLPPLPALPPSLLASLARCWIIVELMENFHGVGGGGEVEDEEDGLVGVDSEIRARRMWFMICVFQASVRLWS